PFRKREVEGFVVDLRKDVPRDLEVHEIRSVVDRSPLVRPDIFKLCRWIAEYYVSPVSEVLKAALPPGILPSYVMKHSLPRRGRVDAPLHPDPPLRGEELVLTPDQARALTAIKHSPGFHPILLHGVTGSGKTEIYMRAVEHFLAAGRTSLVLVPEIGLTPQLTDRFAERFPAQTAILHSSLTRRQRIDEWLRIYRGEAPIVIGTRSAVFAPLPNLGLIVVDEEHETSYKQEEVPRYHARDTAVMRAKFARAAVVPGSATPSMESFHNAESKKYDYVMLTTRVEGRPLPAVEIVNMREEYAAAGKQVVLSRR